MSVDPVVKPIVVAHRGLHDGPASRRSTRPAAANGASLAAGKQLHALPPENTVAAVEAAIAVGADAVELDVRITRDGQLVLSHDGLRWDRSTRLHRPYLISRSAHRSVAFLGVLDDAVDAALAAGAAVKLDVKAEAAFDATVRWCRDRNLPVERIGLWCRSPERIAALRRSGRSGEREFGEVALLSNGRDARAYATQARECGATAVSLHPDALTREAVSVAHECGLVVYAWIFDPNKHAAAVGMGVDGLVTDWVRSARAAVR